MAEKTAEQAPERAALRWVGGALLGVILGGAALYFLARPDNAAGPEETAAAPAPVMDEPAESKAEAPQEADTAATAVPEVSTDSAVMAGPVAPSFDTVRVEVDGSVLVAGRAGAGASVSILVDDAEAATAEADGKGAFAALFMLGPSAVPRVMTLVATAPDGRQVVSEGSVVIGPVAAPEMIAEASPESPPDAPAAMTDAVEPAPESPDKAPTVAEEPAAPAETGEAEAVAAAKPDAPEVLVIDNDGVRRQTEVGAVADVVIDTIGYGSTGDVEIAGRGTAGQFVRIYVDNADTAAVRIGEDGRWAAVLSDVAPGRYVLRVDQLDGAGKVTSRFETPFQREAPEDVLAALQPDGPATDPADPGTAPQGSGAAVGESPSVPETSASQTPEVPQPDAAPEVGNSTIAGPAEPAGTTTEIAAPAGETAPRPATRAAIVTVQPGYSLWRIARENYGDGFLYVKVFEANKDQIRDPDLIYPGQIFTIPDPAE